MSAEPSPDLTNVTVQHMREAVAARAENTSLRDVARAIGMSPAGLKKFLEGAAPYTPTLRRLRRWYVHHGAVQQGTVQIDDALAAIGILAHDLPPHGRRALAARVVDEMGRAYDESGRPRPAWLPELLAHYESLAPAPEDEAE